MLEPQFLFGNYKMINGLYILLNYWTKLQVVELFDTILQVKIQQNNSVCWALFIFFNRAVSLRLCRDVFLYTLQTMSLVLNFQNKDPVK